jgi:hypothetical protein
MSDEEIAYDIEAKLNQLEISLKLLDNEMEIRLEILRKGLAEIDSYLLVLRVLLIIFNVALIANIVVTYLSR